MARTTPISRRAGGLAVLGAALAVTGAACGRTAAAGPRMPLYAYRTKNIQLAYEFATGAGGALLAQLPCYCGCVDLGHGSLRDCFISAAGVFDPHAAGCDVCVSEALDARGMVAGAADRPVAEIRAFIDGKYAGTGKPTKTPPVA